MNNNHLLITYLSITYVPFGIFTIVESALQIRLFMQNKAKFQKVKLSVNKVLTKDYEKKDTWWSGKKQSQTNPNKAKFKKAKMNVTSIITVDYENKSHIRAPKKQSQTSKRQKSMQTSLPQRIMKKTALSASDKTKPNKANLSRRSLWRSRNKPNFKANIMLMLPEWVRKPGRKLSPIAKMENIVIIIAVD